MHQQKPYAIRCSTEEQARECYELKLAVVDDTIDAQKESTFEAFGYTIITYEEAIEKGLLGEPKQETPSEESKIDIDSIREELNIGDWIDVGEDEEGPYATRDEEYAKKDLKETLEKHRPQEKTIEIGDKETKTDRQKEFEEVLVLATYKSNKIKRLMQRMLHKHGKLQQDNLPKLLYEDGYKKKIRKLKNQWTATRRKRKGCSYEEDRCMLTIINDLETLLSTTDTK